MRARVGPNPAGCFVLASRGGWSAESPRMPVCFVRSASSGAARLTRAVRRPRPLAALAAGLLAGSLTHAARAQSLESDESVSAGPRATVPVTARLDEYPPPSARRNLLIAGAVTTASWYGLALASSYLWPDTVGAKDLRIPVAGPWIALSHSGCGDVADCSKVLVVIRAIATTIDAIGQASGLAIAGEGLFLPTREPKRALPEARVEWRPTFDAGRNTVGLGVLGVF